MREFDDLFKSTNSWHELKNKMILFANGDLSFVGKKLFENFAKYFFLCNPILKNDYKNVWLYNEIPYEIKEKLNLPHKDYGIDLVLEDHINSFYAVQCKFKENENTKICWTKDKIGNFFGSTDMVKGYIVFSKTYDIDDVSSTRSKQFQFINISDLLEITQETFKSIYDFIQNSRISNQCLDPKPHQKLAIENSTEYYKINNRGKLILPCGAGKTLTSLWIKEALNANSCLVILPSLSLLRQFKNEWKKQTKENFDYLCVCSDSDIDNDEDIIQTKTYQVDYRVTSDPKIIKNFLEKKEKRIIFSTYQSLDKIKDAISGTGLFFDFAVCDEAHRTAGARNKNTQESNYALIHDDININVKNRLYMTATPRVATSNAKSRAKDEDILLYCMDDERLFGKEIHRMSFAQAIDEDVLVDYKIIAVGVYKDEISNYLNEKRLKLPNYSLDDIANNYTLEFILDKYLLSHAITFHTRVKYAENFEQIHKKIADKTLSFSISGKNSSTERSLKLNSFKNHPRSVISNAKCLTEGVDVPAIDAVIFCDPKNSKIDIVQAAGRALRIYPNKELGYIVIPIYHSENQSREDVVGGEAFKRLIDVIKAMADHDERLQDEIDNIASKNTNPKNDSKVDYIENNLTNDNESNITLLNFDEDLKKYIFAEIIEKASNGWNLNYQKLCDYLKERGGIYPEKSDNLNLHSWVSAQRTFKNKGKLNQDRINKLNKINIIWDQQEYSWNEKYQKLIDWKKSNLHPSKTWPAQRSTEPLEHELAVWLLKLRSDYKKGIMTEDRFNKLLEINFSFDPYVDKWLMQYEKLKEFINQNNRFPNSDKREVGNYIWLKNQIDNFSKLSKHQQELLEKINYDKFEDQFDNWSKNYDKLSDFIQHNNKLPKDSSYTNNEEKNIKIWLNKQRVLFRNNELESNQIKLLFDLEDAKNFLQLEGGKKSRYAEKSLIRCKKLIEFRKNNPNRWPSQVSEDKNENDLAKWIGYVKSWHNGKLKRTGPFPKELYEQLLKIGFNFEAKTINSWEFSYDYALKMLNENNGILDKKSSTWLTNQKSAIKKNLLDSDKTQKIELLEKIRKNKR